MEHLLKSGVPVGMVQIPQAEYDDLLKQQSQACPECHKRREQTRLRVAKSRLKAHAA